MVWFLTLWNEKTICASDHHQHISVWDRKFKIISHTSLFPMIHWMSQVGCSLSLALLNAVSMLAFIVSMLCDWDLKDLIAWGSWFFISLPENQKECSARRVITDKIISYALKLMEFVIPAMARNLESPWTFNKYDIQNESRVLILLGMSYVHLVKIQKEIVEIKSNIKSVFNTFVNKKKNCLQSIKYVLKIYG